MFKMHLKFGSFDFKEPDANNNDNSKADGKAQDEGDGQQFAGRRRWDLDENVARWSRYESTGLGIPVNRND